MYWSTRLRPGGRSFVGLAVAAVVAAGTVAVALPAAADVPSLPPASSTVVVHADQPFRPVSHVATGSLYGLANATTPADDLVSAIKPNTFVQMPIGGHQQPTGDIGQVWQKAARAGAKVVDRLSDYYAGWPYQFSWSSWFPFVQQQIQQVKASGMTNLASYALWNEPDGTWLSANGTFEDFWTKTYNYVRSLDPTTPIQGPSFSDNISDMQNFLQHAVATNTVPDILAWHELSTSSKIAGDVAKVESIEDALGIARRPIAIEEYAAPPEVGIPGDLVGYIAKFERLGIDNAELAFWNQSGALGDLLTGQGGSPNGAYWLYTWYAGMSGNMVTTTPPANNDFDAAASVTDDKKEVDVVTGGNSGPSAVQIDGLGALSMGSDVNVELQMTPSYGRTTPTAAPITISDTTYHVGADGSITVPVVMNPAYGYHVVVTPAGSPRSLAGTYTLTNVNSGLALDATGTGAVDQQAGASGDPTQTWQLVDAGSGLYKIVDVADGRLLGVPTGTGNGAPAAVSASDGADDQLWQLVPDGKGNYRLANFGTGYVLAVSGMSKTAGAPVVQWTDGASTSACTAAGPRQPGRIGNALSFCDTSAYVSMPTGVVSGLTGDYTVSAWVDPASNATWQRVFDIGSGSNASMFLTLNDGKELRYAITTSGAGGEQHLDSSAGTLPLNQWSLVTVTVSGTTGTLYVNGKVVATNPNMTIHPSAFGASTRNYLGKSQYGGDPALNATIDDFNIYDRALTADEVATLAAGQPGSGDVVHYAFDESGGATVVDSSGAGRNATIVNGNASASTTATDAATADHFWTLTPALVPTHVVTGAAAPVDGWYAGKVIVTLATTQTGDQIQFRVDGAGWRTYHKPFVIAADGVHTVDVRLLSSNVVVDGSTGSFPVRIDKKAPSVHATVDPANGRGTPRNPVTVSFTASDAASGVASIEYAVNGGTWKATPAGQAITFAAVGTYAIAYRATDVAGNVSATRTIAVVVADDPATIVKVSPRKVAAGGYVTVSVAGFHRYTTVAVDLGGAALGSFTTDVNGSGRITVQIAGGTAAADYVLTAAESDGGLSASTNLRVTN